MGFTMGMCGLIPTVGYPWVIVLLGLSTVPYITPVQNVKYGLFRIKFPQSGLISGQNDTYDLVPRGGSVCAHKWSRSFVTVCMFRGVRSCMFMPSQGACGCPQLFDSG